jgi:hypothetical protein
VSDYRQEINQILQRASGDSDGDVSLLEEAARLTDLQNDVALGLKVRMRLVTAANWSGNYESCLAAFTWCLATTDSREDLRGEWEPKLLWYYKWIIDSLADYPEVTREQLTVSLADMTRRYQRAGYGMHAIHKCRMEVLLSLGEYEAHREARLAWLNSPKDRIADCEACETSGEVRFHLRENDFASAMKVAEPIIAGRLRCKSVPCTTFSELLLPALQAGQTEQADHFHQASFPQIAANRKYTAAAGLQCSYLALTGNLNKAIRMFETGMSWMMMQKRAWERMVFPERSVVLFDRLVDLGNQPFKLRIPESVPFHRPDDTYEPSTIRQGLLAMHGELLEAYNRRNGNTYMSQRYANFQAMVSTIQPAEAR